MSSADSSAGAGVRPETSDEPGSAHPRDERIAELREEYQAGTYEIDGAKVSAKIIEKHLEK